MKIKMTIRTYKIKHNQDFSNEIATARLIVDSVIQMRQPKAKRPTSKLFKSYGLPSTISDALIRKYWNNKKLKVIKKDPKLTFNHNNHKQIYLKDGILNLTPIKMKIDISKEWWYREDIDPLNLEFDSEFLYLSVQFPTEQPQFYPDQYLGIDLNATGDLVVLSDAMSGKVHKMGKELLHKKQRFTDLKSARQRAGCNKFSTKEVNYTKDACRKIAVEVVDLAVKYQSGIRMEDLKGLRKSKKKPKALNKILAKFPFYQLRQCIEYRAEKMGVPFELIDPRFTSQGCSRCHCIGTKDSKPRNKKLYLCDNCGHKDHADSNGAFNIAQRDLFAPWSAL